MKDADVIVIGSGAGGMAAAVALARANKRVMVFEQHYLPGGWCHSFPMGGYQFSPGVHYIGDLGPGGNMRRIYEGLGVANDLVFLELNPDGYDHVHIGDEYFDIPKGREVYAERLKSRFPSEADGIDRYLATCTRISNQISDDFEVRTFGDAIKAGWRKRDLFLQGLLPLDRFLDRFTKNPLLRAILTIQSGDHGVGPRRALTAIHAAVASHYFDGGWYPKGGAKALPRAFIKELRRCGGEISVRTGVNRILIEGHGSTKKVAGVQLESGEQILAPLVISNADPVVTYGKLVESEHLHPKINRHLRRTKWSTSALSLFLAVDMDVRAAGLDSGNYWWSKTPDIQANYDIAAKPNLDESRELPSTFLTCTTLKDPSKRAHGHHTMEAFSFVSWEAFRRWESTRLEARPEAYKKFKENLTARMFEALENTLPGIRDATVFAELGTPLTNHHYVASTSGNLYGTEKTRSHVGPFSWPIKTPINGLMMCGASTSGHGVAGATMSGLAAAHTALGCSYGDLFNPVGQSLRCHPADHPELWPEELRHGVQGTTQKQQATIS